MSDFVENFKDILIDRNMSIQELSKKTGIDDSNLYDYLHGAIPNVSFAVKIANILNCSLNFLMGLDDEPNSIPFKQNFDISLFSDRYDNLLKENKITHFRLCKERNLNYSSHYAWQRGSVPAMSSLIIIASYFGTSIDYLVGRSDKK